MPALTEEEIMTVLEKCRITNPFRYLPEVAKDFNLLSEDGKTEDIFRTFLCEEVLENSRDPHGALETSRKEVQNALDALKDFKNARADHPLFSQWQLSLLHFYLKDETSSVLNWSYEMVLFFLGTCGDILERQMLAAVDARNSHSWDEVEAMFMQVIEQMDRLLATLDTLKIKKSEVGESLPPPEPLS